MIVGSFVKVMVVLVVIFFLFCVPLMGLLAAALNRDSPESPRSDRVGPTGGEFAESGGVSQEKSGRTRKDCDR